MLRRTTLLMGLVASVIAVSSVPSAAQRLLDLPTGHEFAVGQNLAKESCNTRLAEQRKEPNPFQRFNIHCAGWEQPVGSLVALPDASRPLQWWLTESPWRRERLNAFDCPNDTSPVTLADGTTALAQFCRVRQAGWPMVLLATQRSGRTYLGQAVPPVFPLLDESVLVLEGKRPAQEDRAERVKASLRVLEARLGPGVGWGTKEMREFEALFQFGVAAEEADELWRAEEAFRRALAIQERLFGMAAPGGFRTLTWLANVISRQGRLTEADLIFERSAAWYAQEGRSDARQLRLLLGWRGLHEIRNGRQDSGIALLIRASQVSPTDQRPSPGDQATALYHLGQGHLFARQFGDAVAAGEAAIRNAEAASGRSVARDRRLWMLVGKAYEYWGKPAEALKFFQREREIADLYFGDSLPTAQALIRVGGVERRPEAALASMRRAAAIAKRHLGHPLIAQFDAGLVLGASLGPPNSSVAGEALGAEMFEVAQLSRSSTATRAVTLMTARLASGDPRIAAITRDLQDATNARESSRATLAEEMGLPQEKRSPERQRSLESSVRETANRVAQLERQLIAANPRYGALALPQILAAKEAAALLEVDEAIVQFVETTRRVFVVLARRDGFAARAAGKTSGETAALIQKLRQGVEGAESVRPFDLDAAHELYRLLLAPLADRLQGVKHLHVVANGALASLPLGLLVTAPPTEGDYAGAAWLAKQVSISVLPSVRSLAELRQAKAAPAAAQPFLGIGNPALGQAGTRAGLERLNDACLTDKPVDRALLAALPALPETEKELRAIGATLKAGEGGVLAGRNATKARLRQQDLSKYRVLSFATHGVLPAELRCNNEPGLILTAAGEDDGFLRASEIATLKLNADFVVLSACNTAGPGATTGSRLATPDRVCQGCALDGATSSGGDALSGLAQAFIYAGARSVLASHWSVASEPTVTLTTGLFEAWTKNPQAGRAAALKSVQEAMIKNPATAHPIFWAPFVLVGDRG